MDNFWKSCPPKMSDARFLTDYRTAVRREEYVKQINGFVRDDEYRMFLQKNGETIQDGTWESLKKNNSCWVNDCVHNYPTRVVPPQFVEERRNYDAIGVKPRTKTFACAQQADYRMVLTNGTKF